MDFQSWFNIFALSVFLAMIVTSLIVLVSEIPRPMSLIARLAVMLFGVSLIGAVLMVGLLMAGL